MGWAEDAIWWHCYPLGFVGAEKRGIEQVQHRLGQLEGWLDYLVELGANGLLLAPIFASVSHGYDTLDHYRIDPRLGDAADFARLIAAAKQRGIRVALDGVFNHVSDQHEIVKAALAGGPNSEAGAWIKWVGEYPRGFEGNLDLIELNLENAKVQAWVAAVMNYWLEQGIDAWRLDAAYAPGPEVWRPITQAVRAQHSEAWLLGEVIHGDYPEFVELSGFDSVTEYELWKSIWSSLNERNFFELDWTLRRHAQFVADFKPLNFISNHDVTRIASKLTEPRHLPLAHALLLLLPGIPSIYAGDEQSFTGEKTDGPTGDDAVRPPFPATPQELVPYGKQTYDLDRELIHLRRSNPWLVGAELTVREVTNESIAIDLVGAEHQLTLALNASTGALELPGVNGPLLTPACSWRLG